MGAAGAGGVVTTIYQRRGLLSTNRDTEMSIAPRLGCEASTEVELDSTVRYYDTVTAPCLGRLGHSGNANCIAVLNEVHSA